MVARAASPTAAEPLTVRVVKGANMEMERVEASIGGLAASTLQRKVETDANYKRMLRYDRSPRTRGSVNIGVASHNLFDVALALLWADRQGVVDRDVQFEMLEGMANHQRRAICRSRRQNVALRAGLHADRLSSMRSAT